MSPLAIALAVFAGALVLRAARVPGGVTWSLLAAVIVFLLATARLEEAALAGVAGLLGLGGGVVVRSLRREP